MQIEDGVIQDTSGDVIFNVEFMAIACLPQLHEVLDGRIVDVVSTGITVQSGPIETFIPLKVSNTRQKLHLLALKNTTTYLFQLLFLFHDGPKDLYFADTIIVFSLTERHRSFLIPHWFILIQFLSNSLNCARKNTAFHEGQVGEFVFCSIRMKNDWNKNTLRSIYVASIARISQSRLVYHIRFMTQFK